MARRLATVLLALFASMHIKAGDFATERQQMLEEISRLAVATAADTGRAALDARVLDAMARVPREKFVPANQVGSAYKNRPLAIGHGQTVSQPFIVALMTDLLQLNPADTVLEVGTGSGYQTAVLSLLARKVCTIEILPELGTSAAARLGRLGYANIATRIGDGYQGWPEYAPFDAIIVTAAPDHVPSALVEQLKPKGRMVIPVGGQEQDLMVITKNPNGTTANTTTIPVRFVPLVKGGANH